MDWIALLSSIGRYGGEYLWIPLGIWTVAALPLFFLSRYLGVRQPGIHYQACMALLFSLPLGFLVMQLAPFEVPGSEIPAQMTTYIDSFVGSTGEANDDVPLQIEPDAQGYSAPAERIHFDYAVLVGGGTFLFFLVGGVGLFGLSYRMFKEKQLYSKFSPVTNSNGLAVLLELAHSLGIKRTIDLRTGGTGIIPCTFGVRSPVIVVPEEIVTDIPALKPVLLHELVHIQRNDYLLGLITRVIAALFAFHPLVYFLRRDLTEYRELSCDHEVISHNAISTADYARLLLRFSRASRSPFSLSMIPSRSSLKKRISSMQRYSTYNAFVSRAVLPVIFFVPVIFLSCSSGQEVEQGEDGEVMMKEIGLALQLPDGWVQHEYSSMSIKDSYEGCLDSTPENIQYLCNDQKFWSYWFIPDITVHGNSFFLFSNVSEDNVWDVIEGKQEFYRYELSLSFKRRQDRERNKLWSKGECINPQTGEPWLCQRTSENHRMIRQLDESELLFDADSGYVFDSNYQYGNKEGMHSKNLIYYFYKTRGNKLYRFRLTGTATQPDHATITEGESLLIDESISDMLASIRFL